MGFGGMSVGSLLLILVIVLLLFGTKKLGNIGADLGNAIKGFKKAVSDEDKAEERKAEQSSAGEKQSVENKNDDK